jgi:hypothetical protein
LGEPIYGHQAPNGWPETGEPWMNTGAILSRINYGMTVATGRLPGLRLNSWPDYARLRRAPREEQVNGVIASLLGGEVSAETRSALLSGANPLLSRLSDTAQAPVDEAVDSVGRGGAAVGDSGMTLGPPPAGKLQRFANFAATENPPMSPIPPPDCFAARRPRWTAWRRSSVSPSAPPNFSDTEP